MLSKEIKMESQAWCDMVFEGKNKNYGAYEMRISSSQRHIRALLLVAAMAAVAITIPNVLQKLRTELFPPTAISINTPVELSTLETEKDIPVEKIVPPVAPTVPQLLKATVGYVAPTMTDISQITDDNRMLSTDKLLDNSAAISVKTVAGSTDFDAIDIIDVEQNLISGIVDDPPMVFVDQMPEFIGGAKDLFKFIADNLHYPTIAAANGVHGTATVRFVVDKDGSVTNVELLRGFDKLCDQEAMRVIKMMPKWQAGRQNGKTVKVYYSIPIKFILEN